MMKRIFFPACMLLLLFCACGQSVGQSADQYPIYELEEQTTLSAAKLTDVYASGGQFCILGKDAEGAAALWLFDTDTGTETAVPLPGDLDAKCCAAAGSDLWLGTDDTIVHLDQSGEILTTFEVQNKLVDLAIGENGDLFAAYQDTLLEYTAEGVLQNQYDAPEDYKIGELTALSDGRIACQAASNNSYSMGRC